MLLSHYWWWKCPIWIVCKIIDDGSRYNRCFSLSFHVLCWYCYQIVRHVIVWNEWGVWVCYSATSQSVSGDWVDYFHEWKNVRSTFYSTPKTIQQNNLKITISKKMWNLCSAEHTITMRPQCWKYAFWHCLSNHLQRHTLAREKSWQSRGNSNA